ncbi:MAG TPA: glycosyltransferase family 1 protein [Candidatus Altiarchaeales archaeon]|nr:glycosyltransferase family 1 protein [Candidatus Altiarchaeales archaeon]
MRILQTARWFFPHVGGASIRVYQIARNLVKFGHDVHLLVHNPKSIEQCNLEQDAPSYEEYEGIHVYRLPYFGPNPLYWGLSIPLMAKRAIDIIKKQKIDVILSHNPPYLVGTSSWIASKFTGVPFVLNVHDVWGASHYSYLQYRIGLFLEKFCIRRARNILVPCQGIDDILMQRTGAEKEKFTLALTAVDSERFKPLPKKDIEKTKKELRIGPDRSVILFLGTLAPWKGADYLINAAPGIIKEKPDTMIVFVGHGVSLDELKTKVKEMGLEHNISFLGPISYFRLPQIINCADICVSSFPKPETVGRRTTARSLSILEFMSCSKAVVLPRNPGFEDFIEDGVNGLFFEPENIKDLKDKILYLLNNNKVSIRIGKNARHTVLKDYTWEDTARVVEKVLLDEIK